MNEAKGQEATTRADYPHFLIIPTRWKDNDVYGHVNNVVYYAYFDTVINEYLIRHGGLDYENGEIVGICAESSCRFKAALAFPEQVEARLRVARLGRRSVVYEIGLFKERREEPAAEGRFVHVFAERRDLTKVVEIPEEMRRALEALHVDRQ